MPQDTDSTNVCNADSSRGFSEIARAARLNQVRRNILATVDGVLGGVLTETGRTGTPEAPVELRALAQRLFIESACVLADLEAGPSIGDDRLIERIQSALATLSGEATASNQARDLRRAIRQVAEAGLADLERAEGEQHVTEPERPDIDKNRRREAPADPYRSALVDSVIATVGPELSRRLEQLKSDGKDGLLINALRATKTTPYAKKGQRQVDAMVELLKALGLPLSERSMQGRNA